MKEEIENLKAAIRFAAHHLEECSGIDLVEFLKESIPGGEHPSIELISVVIAEE